MRRYTKPAAKALGAAAAVVLVAGIVAPWINAGSFENQIRQALQQALHRRVEIGEVHFNVFTGLGFTLENVTIYEDPFFGLEPVAYVTSVEAVPRLWSLWTRKLEFASITLDDASINVAKNGTRWNFEPLLSRGLIAAFPSIHVRDSRINFRSGYEKSVFYVTGTDLDISPPARSGAAWTVRFSGAPARTDRPTQGLGSIVARGRWNPAARNGTGWIDFDVQMEKSPVGEMIALVRERPGIHGTVSSHLRLVGPLDDVRINGRLTIEDVHRWDLLPPHGEGWPLGLQGRLNAIAQTIELESSSSGTELLPLTVRFRAANYLSDPKWGFSFYWNRFPLGPLLDLARHMGVMLPPRLQLAGTVDGAISYTGEGAQGELSFHDTAVTIPDSPPIRFEQAGLLFDGGHAHLTPAIAHTASGDEAQLEADYAWESQNLDLTISTGSMNVNSLRAQVALAAVPWLGSINSGVWKGSLRYETAEPGWTGRIELTDAEVPVPGIAAPLRVDGARAQIDGARLVLDRIRARVGDISVEGDYRYEPQSARPHRVRISLGETDAAEAERLLLPTLRRSRGSLIARALGLARAPVPEWLAQRRVDGTVQIRALVVGGQRIENVRGRLLWDATRVRLDRLQARMLGGIAIGTMTVSLRRTTPRYLLTARLKGANWKSGKIDVEGAVETAGIGSDLLAGFRSQGVFHGSGLEFPPLPAYRGISGTYMLAWGEPEPSLRLSELQLTTFDGEVYNGRGATQDDGRLVVLLTSGAREMRVSGTLAQLQVEGGAVQ